MPDEYAARLVAAALDQTRSSVTYDGTYRRIGYPGGDVPDAVGVCTDVVIRAYRKVGVDLQVRVHEDMNRAFSAYPQLWGLAGPDANIDHRRVPNLQKFLKRAGAQLSTSRDASAYRAGDLVTWMLPGNLPHIGMVASGRSPAGSPPSRWGRTGSTRRRRSMPCSPAGSTSGSRTGMPGPTTTRGSRGSR
jgi:uncharacterized protein YijF (DUF1287 family)